MEREEQIAMSMKEMKRHGIIQEVLGGRLSQQAAVGLLGVGERQVRRLVSGVRRKGPKGVVHGLRGRASNRRIEREFRRRVLAVYQKKYSGYGPQFASEKLWEEEKWSVHQETLRLWLQEEGIAYPRRRRRKGRSRR